MPDITFILPHWIYWGGIAAVPVFFMLASRRAPARGFSPGLSLPLAYFFWAISGFMGIHRLYLKSWGAAVFIALFVSVIFCNHEARLTRNEHSIAKHEVFNIAHDLRRAQDDDLPAAAIARLQRDQEAGAVRERELAARLENWRRASSVIALVVLCLLVAEAFLMPATVRRARARLAAAASDAPHPSSTLTEAAAVLRPVDGGRFVRAVSRINSVTGEFATYWTVIAVFVFYYEVIARYIFNSPTIWAHESMFLLFGMQYMLAGGFCLRENAHVRVDVIYMHLSLRARAMADLATSVFFFIFTVSLLVTGWIFFSDSFAMRQVSFTEWEIPYWPIKFALPLGGALIVLQGAAHVLQNIAVLRGGKSHGH